MFIVGEWVVVHVQYTLWFMYVHIYTLCVVGTAFVVALATCVWLIRWRPLVPPVGISPCSVQALTSNYKHLIIPLHLAAAT